eukprot:CAMPEP_0172744458 /NCGR_PEP_ID=MMETSP1074-20121228/135275_1 /TAXON_ID=2916 /ORGANISM="Ceratium fusus, Strain PA161109" /LENGTH=37 /DNA_ID= /DNA_START= /DNA_END= /DNA_ORIENTATION=
MKRLYAMAVIMLRWRGHTMAQGSVLHPTGKHVILESL